MTIRSSAVVVAAYPLAQLACAFALGILAGTVVPTYHTLSPIVAGSLVRFSLAWILILGGALLSVSALAAVLKDKLRSATLLVLVATALFGCAFAMVEKSSVPSNQIRRLLEAGVIQVGEPIELTGVLDQEPELAPDRIFLPLRIKRLRVGTTEMQTSGVVMLSARLPQEESEQNFAALDLHYGASLRLMTRLERADSFRNPGVASFSEYMDRQGYDATAIVKSPLLVERLENERVFMPLAWLYEWRNKVQKAIHSHFSSETAGVLDAAILGNRYFLSQSTSERFREGGTFHVLVISGLHITFLGGIVFLIARRFTRNRGIQFGLSTIVLWSYALAVGAEASVVRAALMFTIVVLAPLVSRHASSLNALGGSAVALLAWRPSDLLDPSFQLTFASVAAIVLLSWPLLQKLSAIGAWRPTRESPYPPLCPQWLRGLCESLFWSERQWRSDLEQTNYSYKLFKRPSARHLERFHLQRPLRYAFSTIVVSASVQLVLLPLLIVYFHRLSFASLLLNIGVSLMMAAMAIVAVLALLLAQVNAEIAGPFISLANGLNWLTVHSVDPFAKAGIASIRLPQYSGWASVIYVLYYLPLAGLVERLWRWQPLRLSTPRKQSRLNLSFVFIAAQLFVVALVVFHPRSAPPPNGNLYIDFLDVGQGDSALVTFPNGVTLLVDGGGRPGPFRSATAADDAEEKFERDTRSIGESVVSEFLWHRGLDRVDYVLATHADADHIDGLNDIVRNFKVRAAFLARTPKRDPEFARFSETLSAERVPMQIIGGGDQLRCGGVTIDVLWPPPVQNDDLPSQNNDSIVLKVRLGQRSFLLTGDIEARAEETLTPTADGLRADVVKVPHHGSRTSSTAVFIAATQPRYAIISVGQTSIFGHPHSDVVKRWEAAGVQLLRTGNSGTITFTTNGTDLKLETFVPPR
ncbi:MAG TPA: ComEC/Rec2 family competence protein [Pyrinomonadaceae bacterium]|nr:ComEC/Rec2 family competence protein [Pyrinomonadaceae bacterium]